MLERVAGLVSLDDGSGALSDGILEYRNGDVRAVLGVLHTLVEGDGAAVFSLGDGNGRGELALVVDDVGVGALDFLDGVSQNSLAVGEVSVMENDVLAFGDLGSVLAVLDCHLGEGDLALRVVVLAFVERGALCSEAEVACTQLSAVEVGILLRFEREVDLAGSLTEVLELHGLFLAGSNRDVHGCVFGSEAVIITLLGEANSGAYGEGIGEVALACLELDLKALVAVLLVVRPGLTVGRGLGDEGEYLIVVGSELLTVEVDALLDDADLAVLVIVGEGDAGHAGLILGTFYFQTVSALLHSEGDVEGRGIVDDVRVVVVDVSVVGILGKLRYSEGEVGAFAVVALSRDADDLGVLGNGACLDLRTGKGDGVAVVKSGEVAGVLNVELVGVCIGDVETCLLGEVGECLRYGDDRLALRLEGVGDGDLVVGRSSVRDLHGHLAVSRSDRLGVTLAVVLGDEHLGALRQIRDGDDSAVLELNLSSRAVLALDESHLLGNGLVALIVAVIERDTVDEVDLSLISDRNGSGKGLGSRGGINSRVDIDRSAVVVDLLDDLGDLDSALLGVLEGGSAVDGGITLVVRGNGSAECDLLVLVDRLGDGDDSLVDVTVEEGVRVLDAVVDQLIEGISLGRHIVNKVGGLEVNHTGGVGLGTLGVLVLNVREGDVAVRVILGGVVAVGVAVAGDLEAELLSLGLAGGHAVERLVSDDGVVDSSRLGTDVLDNGRRGGVLCNGRALGGIADSEALGVGVGLADSDHSADGQVGEVFLILVVRAEVSDIRIAVSLGAGVTLGISEGNVDVKGQTGGEIDLVTVDDLLDLLLNGSVGELPLVVEDGLAVDGGAVRVGVALAQ